MRILIYGLNFHPELTGIGKYTGEMVQYLAGQGHQVRVITTPPYYPYWKVQPPYSAEWYRKENTVGITVYRCPLWVPKHPTGIKRLFHLASFAMSSLPVFFAQINWKPEVVFCVAPALANAPLALLFGKITGAKTWLHIQDFEVDAALNLGLLPSKLSSPALAIERKL
jgi:colanic acid biosynthesis glycosyl transferase WcaI